jgi:hypothetical protein
MSEQEAIGTLKINVCQQCASGYSCMEECNIGYCDNREALKTLMMAMDARKEKKHFIVRSFMDILSDIQNATCNGMVLQPSSESILNNATKVYMKQLELAVEMEAKE